MNHPRTCGCEYGGDCTKTTVCALDSALQDQADEVRALIHDCRDSWAPDHPPHDLAELMDEIELLLEKIR